MPTIIGISGHNIIYTTKSIARFGISLGDYSWIEWHKSFEGEGDGMGNSSIVVGNFVRSTGFQVVEQIIPKSIMSYFAMNSLHTIEEIVKGQVSPHWNSWIGCTYWFQVYILFVFNDHVVKNYP